MRGNLAQRRQPAILQYLGQPNVRNLSCPVPPKQDVCALEIKVHNPAQGAQILTTRTHACHSLQGLQPLPGDGLLPASSISDFDSSEEQSSLTKVHLPWARSDLLSIPGASQSYLLEWKKRPCARLI